MQVWILGLAVAIGATLSSPALAQQAPAGATPTLQETYTGPSIPHWGYVPNAADIRKANAAENPAVRNVAQSVYGQLVADNLNRAKLTQDVNSTLPDSTEKMLSQRLAEMGNPTWTFVRNEQTSAGTVSLYALKYATSSVYVTFGVDDNGVVYALGLSKGAPLP